MDVMEAYTDIIKENIEYEYLLRDNPYKKDVIEEILNLIVETVSVKRKTVRIAGANYPYEVVKGWIWGIYSMFLTAWTRMPPKCEILRIT